MNTDIIMGHTVDGTPIFETKSIAMLYRRGSPPKGVNMDCTATIQCYVYPDGDKIGIWAEGVHIRVPLKDIAAVVGVADKTMRGFGEQERGSNV